MSDEQGWPEQLTHLNELLAMLYPDEDAARRVVTIARIPSRNIRFDASARINWFNILQEADRQNRVADIVATARREFPDNQGWADVEADSSRPVKRFAYEYMSTEAFDLDDQEKIWRRALATREKRLVVLVLRDADDYVRDSVVRRLERYLTDVVAPRKEIVTLRPEISPTREAADRVVHTSAALSERHVLCIVSAERATPEVACRFLQGVREKLPDTFARHLVLLVTLVADFAIPGEHVEIPPPIFEEWHLEDWVTTVSRGKGWPPDLVNEFAAAIVRQARYDDTFMVGRVYGVLTSAIELLSMNPDLEVMRQRLRTGL